MSNLKSASIYLSLILRHKPEEAGIELDKNGWAKVDELIKGVRRKYPLDMETLEEIVATDNKQRYSFNEDHTKIRANQGHSVPADVELEERTPPEILFHGTGEKYVSSINAQGLLPKGRLYVHLSSDIDTAKKVGSRHGKPAIYRVDCAWMAADGFVFYLSANGVWLTKAVPPKYLECLEQR
jgi:putative RNA 2'-phosphotransferase